MHRILHASHFISFLLLLSFFLFVSFLFFSFCLTHRNDSMFWPIAYWYREIHIKYTSCARDNDTLTNTTLWPPHSVFEYVSRFGGGSGERVRSYAQPYHFKFDSIFTKKNTLTNRAHKRKGKAKAKSKQSRVEYYTLDVCICIYLSIYLFSVYKMSLIRAQQNSLVQSNTIQQRKERPHVLRG